MAVSECASHVHRTSQSSVGHGLRSMDRHGGAGSRRALSMTAPVNASARANNMLLFVTAVTLGGMGGLIGSVLGGGFGKTGLFVGGYAGGLLVAPVTALVARKR